ncbi:MAG: hypothetical protein QXT13_07545 [Pyrobaculum sp.]
MCQPLREAASNLSSFSEFIRWIGAEPKKLSDSKLLYLAILAGAVDKWERYCASGKGAVPRGAWLYKPGARRAVGITAILPLDRFRDPLAERLRMAVPEVAYMAVIVNVEWLRRLSYTAWRVGYIDCALLEEALCSALKQVRKAGHG